MPEVVNSALFLAMSDVFFPAETSFLHWVGGIAESTFRSPMYRLLMVVASPQALANGGARRWSAFHVGTEYETKVGDNGTQTTLTYPANAFDSLVVRGTLRAIQAAPGPSGSNESALCAKTAMGFRLPGDLQPIDSL